VIPDDVIREVRERTDLASLVGQFVRLRKQGASFKGLCPFHPEKTPSFYVHPARGFYHCFGCGASGDAFAFLMRLEGRPFPEVARDLAERAGVEIPDLAPAERAEADRARARERRLTELMDTAAGFYLRQLREHPHAEGARELLRTRGVSPEVAETFRLGYAPYGWDLLGRYLEVGGWSPAEAEAVGLLVPRKSGRGHYDRFRHRLVFPVADVHGRIVAFSGRSLPPPPGEEDPSREAPAKYVNSPESPLYRKGDVLFGLHEARVAVRREGWAVLCEGNFDLLALHQAGLPNAVAPLGTALTEAQARLLRRFAEVVVLLFDGDRAGRAAVRSAYPVLARVGLAAKVASLPPGEDPDSFLRSQGADALVQRVRTAPGIVEHLIDAAAREAAGDPRASGEAIADLGPVLARVDNPVEARLYVERVARRFGVSDIDVVRRQLRRGLRAAREREQGGRRRPSGAPGSVDRGPPARGGHGPPGEVPPRGGPSRREAPVDEAQVLPPLERALVGALLDQPSLLHSEEAGELPHVLTSPGLRAMVDLAARTVQGGRALNGSLLLEQLTTTISDPGQLAVLRRWLEGRLAVQEYDAEAAQTVLADGLPRLARRYWSRQLPRLDARIVDARRRGDDQEADALTRERDAVAARARDAVGSGTGGRGPRAGDPGAKREDAATVGDAGGRQAT